MSRRLGGLAIRGGSFGGLRLDGLREDGLGCLGLSLAQGREGFLDAGGILLLCQGLDRFGQRLVLVLVFLHLEVLAPELLGQHIDGFARRFGGGDPRLRLPVALVPGIPDAEHDEEHGDPEAVAQQGLNDDPARPSIDGRQDPRAQECAVNTKDEEERQSDEDQGIGEVRGHLTEGGELGAHLGEPLRPWSCAYSSKSEQTGS